MVFKSAEAPQSVGSGSSHLWASSGECGPRCGPPQARTSARWLGLRVWPRYIYLHTKIEWRMDGPTEGAGEARRVKKSKKGSQIGKDQ